MKLAELQVYIRERERITIAFLPWWYAWAKGQLDGVGVSVPCDGCGAQCCLTNQIELLPMLDDDPRYKRAEDGSPYLQRRADGACIHLLEDNRCEVHDYPPFTCRTFDCRMYPATHTVVIDRQSPTDELTFACEAGLTRFAVVPTNNAERLAMSAVLHLRDQNKEEGLEAEVAITHALLTWPRLTGGPALSYVQRLEKQTSANMLRTAVGSRRRP